MSKTSLLEKKCTHCPRSYWNSSWKCIALAINLYCNLITQKSCDKKRFAIALLDSIVRSKILFVSVEMQNWWKDFTRCLQNSLFVNYGCPQSSVVITQRGLKHFRMIILDCEGIYDCGVYKVYMQKARSTVIRVWPFLAKVRALEETSSRVYDRRRVWSFSSPDSPGYWLPPPQRENKTLEMFALRPRSPAACRTFSAACGKLRYSVLGRVRVSAR